MTGSSIPPVSVGQKINMGEEVSCFGCGRRRGPLKTNSPTREVAIKIGPLPSNEMNLQITDWRREESFCGICYRVLEGIIIVVPIILLTFIYGHVINYISNFITNTDNDINNTCYFFGFLLTLMNCCLLIILYA